MGKEEVGAGVDQGVVGVVRRDDLVVGRVGAYQALDCKKENHKYNILFYLHSKFT